MTEQTISSDNEWYYVDKGDRKGPVSEAFLSDLIAKKELEAEDQIWRKGMQEWLPIRSSPLSALVASEPPPLESHLISNTFVWTLAFLPIIYEIVDQILLQTQSPKFRQFGGITSIPWQVAWGVNSILAYYDERRLQKAGYSGKYYSILAILLIPIYLFVRAKKLKQFPWYGLVFIASVLIAPFL